MNLLSEAVELHHKLYVEHMYLTSILSSADTVPASLHNNSILYLFAGIVNAPGGSSRRIAYTLFNISHHTSPDRVFRRPLRGEARGIGITGDADLDEARLRVVFQRGT